MTAPPPTTEPTSTGTTSQQLKDKFNNLTSMISKAGQAKTSGSGLTLPQHPAIDSIQNSMRAFQARNLAPSWTSASTKALQLAITSQKGLALDWLAVGRDGTLASKEAFEWGREVPEVDLVDATDRLAYLSFTSAQLATDLAKALDAARKPLKDLRNYQREIDAKVAAAKDAVKSKKHEERVALDREVEELQQSLPIRRRVAVLRSNQESWIAQQTYASKLLLLSHAATLLLPTLESGEWDKDYAGHVRASTQSALEQYDPEHPTKMIEITNWPEGSTALASSRASFAETHQKELSSISRDPEYGTAAESPFADPKQQPAVGGVASSASSTRRFVPPPPPKLPTDEQQHPAGVNPTYTTTTAIPQQQPAVDPFANTSAAAAPPPAIAGDPSSYPHMDEKQQPITSSFSAMPGSFGGGTPPHAAETPFIHHAAAGQEVELPPPTLDQTEPAQAPISKQEEAEGPPEYR